MKYKIIGGKRLSGTVHVSGNKNSVFPCVAAALLTQEEVILENISDLKDTEVLIQILKKLGVTIAKKQSTLHIRAAHLSHTNLPKDLVTQLRGSVVLVGAILGKLAKVTFDHPGGDIIGRRSIEAHLSAFKELGVTIKRNDLRFHLEYTSNERDKDRSIFLSEASVTACENLILASVLGKRAVVLKNCSKEPHVLDLCKMLISMGAKIEGIGTDTIAIDGVDQLFGTKFRIGVDYIEVGTYAIASAITSGEITITGLDNTDLNPLLSPLKRFGVDIKEGSGSISVTSVGLKSIPKLVTNIWPGFPTDLMSAAIVLATQSKGMTLCHDWMYESRMFFIDKLISMGAQINLADPHRVFVLGPAKLKGRILDTPDIRAGMALVLAALIARGTSIINQSELIERGYENVVEKLSSLGGDIERFEV